ncbi:MAG: hypothetical protein QOE96_2218 [Blastocatellia bacterium]|nr:hypothetical protein [Blastocatellia bacterium]
MAIVRTACGSGRAFLVRGRPITHSHCARPLPQAVLTIAMFALTLPALYNLRFI